MVKEYARARDERFQNLKAWLEKLFNRKNGSRWSCLEEQTAVELSDRPDLQAEMELLENFSKNPDSFFPKSAASLLQKWTDTLDRARNYQPKRRRVSEVL